MLPKASMQRWSAERAGGKKMPYVMCYVASVPADKRAEYEAQSRIAAKIFRDHGALRVVECWGDDVPPGKVTSFPLAVKAEGNEVVVLGWQEWPDKATQKENLPKAMKDPRFGEVQGMPIDGKRMIFGGFETVLDI
jgi:uncharacterized protein YbaA (DUF1428 family)